MSIVERKSHVLPTVMGADDRSEALEVDVIGSHVGIYLLCCQTANERYCNI